MQEIQQPASLSASRRSERGRSIDSLLPRSMPKLFFPFIASPSSGPFLAQSRTSPRPASPIHHTHMVPCTQCTHTQCPRICILPAPFYAHCRYRTTPGVASEWRSSAEELRPIDSYSADIPGYCCNLSCPGVAVKRARRRAAQHSAARSDDANGCKRRLQPPHVRVRRKHAVRMP